MAKDDKPITIFVATPNTDIEEGKQTRIQGLVCREGSNYVEIDTPDGRLTITIYRAAGGHVGLGVLISKDQGPDKPYLERRVYQGAIFEQPWEKPLTDAERQELEEQNERLNRLRTPRLAPVPLPVPDPTPVEFTLGDEPDEDDPDEDDPEEDDDDDL